MDLNQIGSLVDSVFGGEAKVIGGNKEIERVKAAVYNYFVHHGIDIDRLALTNSKIENILTEEMFYQIQSAGNQLVSGEELKIGGTQYVWEGLKMFGDKKGLSPTQRRELMEKVWKLLEEYE